MYLETERLIIRDLNPKDATQLYKIVWQKDVVRFMRDWSANSPNAESFKGYIEKHLNHCFHGVSKYLIYHT